uniref:Serpin-like protein n=1 Tax=Ampulex compressa TaxID=860918 RepID=A0A1W6EW69_AMPCP|nr:serpin-like protein [Ampulex compressa]
MKPTRNLGCLSFTLVVLLLAKECTCAVIQSPAVANESARARNENVAPMQMDDDDFVPYQGERSSLFDWMLLKTIGKTFTGNLLVSPISIKLALVLLFEGSQDQTAHELAGVMQLPVSRSGTRDRFTTILRSLKSPPPGCTLNVGTRLYVDNNILTRQRYEAIIKTFYDSDVINTNLSHTSLIAGDINMWVNNITQGNIPRMIEDDSTIKDSLMLVVNALYFKGTWRHKYFLPENTHTGRFYTDGDKSVNVEFMHTTSRLYYSESPELDAKILRIPYSGHKFAMYLVLPRTSSGTDLLIRDINPFILTKHVWLMQELQVDVLLPKFKFDFTSYLEPVLRELGIRDIFDDTAMLIGIARTRRASKHLKVSEIVQKTGIEVNENGTSGYAATVVQISNKIEAETFHANHPFVFYIEDETTGTILYIGKVANPLEKFGSTGSPKQQYPSRFNDGMGATNSPAA